MNEMINALTTTEVLEVLAERFKNFGGVYKISKHVTFFENLTPESPDSNYLRYYSVKAIGPEEDARDATNLIDAALRVSGFKCQRRWDDCICIDLKSFELT